MKRLPHLLALSIIGLALLVPAAGAQSGQQTVSIQDFSFAPAQIAVEPGTTVTWTNVGKVPHTVTADNALFDSGVLYPGDSYRVWLDGAGTVAYRCTIHPSMTGSVTVGGGVQPATEQQPAKEQPMMTGGY